MTHSIKFILIGHGMIAATYIEAIAHMPQAEVVGVVGRSEQRAAEFAKQHRIPHSGTELEQVAASSGASAVIVCTPNGLHDLGVKSAARLGLHVLCEKPLHIDPKLQKQMVEYCEEYCEEHGVVLSVSFMRRFTPHLQWIKSLIDSGQLGQIIVADISLKHYRPPSYYQDVWHGTLAIDGGGPFMQQGIHLIDTIQWLCGGWNEVQSASRYTLLHEIEVEDHGYAVVTYNNGAIGSIAASTACVNMNNERLEISGTKGSITANFDGIIELKTSQQLDIPLFKESELGRTQLFIDLLLDFIQAIHTGATPVVSGSSALAATELVQEIYRIADMKQ